MKERCVNCFKVLSVQSRFKIFNYLKENQDRKTNVTDLVALTGLRQPTVTFHLKELEKIGVLKKEKAGRDVYCQVCQKCENCPLFN